MVNLLKKVTQSDLHGKLASQLSHSKKGFSPKGKVCFSCHLPLTLSSATDKEDVIVFQYGFFFVFLHLLPVECHVQIFFFIAAVILFTNYVLLKMIS
jgi:hypothetical protein